MFEWTKLFAKVWYLSLMGYGLTVAVGKKGTSTWKVEMPGCMIMAQGSCKRLGQAQAEAIEATLALAPNTGGELLPSLKKEAVSGRWHEPLHAISGDLN